jgi:hypothetical protein
MREGGEIRKRVRKENWSERRTKWGTERISYRGICMKGDISRT